MAYKRRISYFDLIEDEQKRGNAGFVKWEKYDECHILSVFVSGLNGMNSKEAKVFLDNEALGSLTFKNGMAEGTYLLAKSEKSWKEEIGAVTIPIGTKRFLAAVFTTGNLQENMKMPDVESVAETEEVPEEEMAVGTEEVSEPEALVLDNRDINEEAEWPTEEKEQGSTPAMTATLWDRLRETHRIIYPFKNEAECYRIFPKDIMLLQGEYQALQNNQFLMHGYYNYRYLILCKKTDREDEYWLGVPGIYHEREKMAARMFGFEKFEGTTKEYRVGDMGYYLITVK